MRPILLRLHRWLTLLFALPLAVVILTGLILSFEPIMQDIGAKPQSLSGARLVSLLDQHDSERKARAILVRSYENRLVFQGVGPDGSLDLDLQTGQVVNDDDRTMLSDVFGLAKGLHEHFLFDQSWVVTASTFAMIVLIVLGVLMGWPKLRQSVSGWHQGMAWFGLPLAVLSPLTGLAIVFGITFTPVAPREAARPVPIREAVEKLSEGRDLSGLIWLRNRGGRLLARVNEGGVFNIYVVSANGAVKAPMNWPRALHEGNFAGKWSGLMVLVTSIGFIGLLVTGLIIYTRRALRPRNRQRVPGTQIA
ncbi:PepSY-associated TM protein [Rhabdaerophilaceae bacterium]